MAKGFADTAGAAKKGGEYYKWIDGDQTIRLVGDIVPRYCYWKQSTDGKNTSVECLGFDRDLEKFTNIEKDWFQHYFPDIKCSWSYVGRAINPEDHSKTILIPLKKKMYQQIQEVAKELGDPTDPTKGWDCIINRKKTGSHNYNVEYTLKQLKCKNRALDDEELAAIENMEPIDNLVLRQSPEEQKAFIEKVFFSDPENTETDDEAVSELEDE